MFSNVQTTLKKKNIFHNSITIKYILYPHLACSIHSFSFKVLEITSIKYRVWVIFRFKKDHIGHENKSGEKEMLNQINRR